MCTELYYVLKQWINIKGVKVMYAFITKLICFIVIGKS